MIYFFCKLDIRQDKHATNSSAIKKSLFSNYIYK